MATKRTCNAAKAKLEAQIRCCRLIRQISLPKEKEKGEKEKGRGEKREKTFSSHLSRQMKSRCGGGRDTCDFGEGKEAHCNSVQVRIWQLPLSVLATR